MMFLKRIISFIFSHLIILLGGGTQIYVAPPLPTNIIATSTNIIISTTTKPKITIKTPPPKKQITPIAKPVVKPIIISTPSPIQPVAEPIPDFETINTFGRGTTINILCTANGNQFSPISGTGVVIKPDGLILTNAHVAQYLLIKDYRQKDFINCVARTGSPAYPRYNLELVYISPKWVENNKTLLKEQNPKGNGENDFAFLRITGSINGSPLPSSFPYIPINTREVINKNEPVILISYPAGFLGGISIVQNLDITSAVTTIKEIFTFKETTVDVLSVPGTVVSQKGSSGGLVVDRHSTLIGMISTSSEGDTTSIRALNAITMAYINRSIQGELGTTLSQFINMNMADFAQTFQKVNVPALAKLIIDELNKQ